MSRYQRHFSKRESEPMNPRLLRTVFAMLGLFVACLVEGCANANKDSTAIAEAALTGTAWQLGKLADKATLAAAQATLEFTTTDQVAGTGNSISFGPLAATRMACGDEINAQEAEYFKALEAAQRYVVDGNTLTIYTKAMDAPLLFIRKIPK
jgi:heat shock protein HslJ